MIASYGFSCFFHVDSQASRISNSRTNASPSEVGDNPRLQQALKDVESILCVMHVKTKSYIYHHLLNLDAFGVRMQYVHDSTYPCSRPYIRISQNIALSGNTLQFMMSLVHVCVYQPCIPYTITYIIYSLSQITNRINISIY